MWADFSLVDATGQVVTRKDFVTQGRHHLVQLGRWITLGDDLGHRVNAKVVAVAGSVVTLDIDVMNFKNPDEEFGA